MFTYCELKTFALGDYSQNQFCNTRSTRKIVNYVHVESHETKRIVVFFVNKIVATNIQ